jgi:hypothetical protein
MRQSVSIRPTASRGLLACVVVSEPSCPVFIACSMSIASPPRHSPTTMRSGRMRSAFFTRSRIEYSPLPSRFGGRDSSATTCGWPSRSSAASSTVTMRSRSGMAPESTLSNVVFPLPVPPAITMFFLTRTERSRKRAISRESEPFSTRFFRVSAVLANLRIVMQGPRSASGGITAFTREPSLSLASTSGVDSSMRRPSGVTMRSITARTASSSVKRSGERSSTPPRSTKIVSGSTTMISLTRSSASRRSSGPRPSASSHSSPRSASRASPAGIASVWPITIRRSAASTLGRITSGSMLVRPSSDRSRCSSS